MTNPKLRKPLRLMTTAERKLCVQTWTRLYQQCIQEQCTARSAHEYIWTHWPDDVVAPATVTSAASFVGAYVKGIGTKGPEDRIPRMPRAESRSAPPAPTEPELKDAVDAVAGLRANLTELVAAMATGHGAIRGDLNAMRSSIAKAAETVAAGDRSATHLFAAQKTQIELVRQGLGSALDRITDLERSLKHIAVLLQAEQNGQVETNKLLSQVLDLLTEERRG